MFQKIIVPIDLTDRHQSILNVASDLAGNSQGEIILLHVIESIAGWEDEEVEEFYLKIEASAQEHLERLGRQLDEKKIPWHLKVKTGSRAKEIAEFAKAENANLIIVSAPQFDPENPSQGWASLSWKISMLTPCPILLVK